MSDNLRDVIENGTWMTVSDEVIDNIKDLVKTKCNIDHPISGEKFVDGLFFTKTGTRTPCCAVAWDGKSFTFYKVSLPIAEVRMFRFPNTKIADLGAGFEMTEI